MGYKGIPSALRLLLIVCSVLVVTGSHAQQLLMRGAPRPIDELTREATDIVRGSVVSARVEPHPEFRNLRTLVVTLAVQETLKGNARRNFEFRQYLWDLRDQRGALKYRKGDQVLLLLGPVSPYGLRSPVGLEQGRFIIRRDASGLPVAENGQANAGLFDSVEKRARSRGVELPARSQALLRQGSRGAVSLEQLEATIRALIKVTQ